MQVLIYGTNYGIVFQLFKARLDVKRQEIFFYLRCSFVSAANHEHCKNTVFILQDCQFITTYIICKDSSFYPESNVCSFAELVKNIVASTRLFIHPYPFEIWVLSMSHAMWKGIYARRRHKDVPLLLHWVLAMHYC